jgi:hypothetical protein
VGRGAGGAVSDERPPLRGWAVLALVHGPRADLVEIRIQRTTFERHDHARARLRLVKRPGISEGAVMSLAAWGELAPVLRASGATIEERKRTAEDAAPLREGSL